MLKLDLVFGIDTTMSMGPYIAEIDPSSITQDVMANIKINGPFTIRFGVITYKDHPPEEDIYLTQKLPLTDNIPVARDWIEELEAEGGGDEPEAVGDCLNEALNMNWTPEALKVVILITDAIPHGYGEGILSTYEDGFPKGCPLGHDPIVIAKIMRERYINLYAVICDKSCERALVKIAKAGGGDAFPLKDPKQFAELVLNILSKVIENP
jgi:hypothetical protein